MLYLQEAAISEAEVSLCDLIADYQAIEEKQSNDWSKLSTGLNNKDGEITPFVQLFPAFWCDEIELHLLVILLFYTAKILLFINKSVVTCACRPIHSLD